MIGHSIGPYQIVAELGRGGMGEVYRARDTRLGRDVAIKILPPAFATNPERLTRFEREARTLAALNHPNIAQVFDAGTHAGTGEAGTPRDVAFLVMEFVDGEDLTATIAQGPVPMREALAIVRQIAAALEAAHEAGIIHRDLKPANIKLRSDGTVKVLDFGLAKALAPDTGVSAADLAHSPTMTSPATAMGLILGTAAYMSPEQARGKPVDRRADVWAFGVVLYELLTGKRAFAGFEVSDVLASVLKDTLPLDAVPADTPPSIRRLLRRCLQKDRNERLDSMATARLDISDALATEGGEDAPTATRSIAAPARRAWWPVAALLIVVAALSGWLGSRWPSSGALQDRRPVQFAIPVPGEITGVAITPDGNTVVVQSDRLYLRGLSDATARPIPGTEGARNLSISPNGQWVAFYAGGKIMKVRLTGGDALAIADADVDSPGVGWGPDDTLLFSPGWNSAMVSVPAAGGGTPKVISTVDTANGELSHWWPQTLPDQKSVVFTVWMAAAGINDARIGVLDLSTGTHQIVGPGAFARYVPSGHLIYFHAGTYHSMKFDLTTLRGNGDPVTVQADIMPHDPGGNRHKPWAMSDDGTLVSIAGPLFQDVRWAWATQEGVATPINLPAEPVSRMDLSADGRWLVTNRVEAGVYTLWLTDLVARTQEKIPLPGSTFNPSWSPDGRFFTFTSMTKGHFDTWRYLMDTGRPVELIAEPLDQFPVAVSSDGTQFILEDTDSAGAISVTHGRIAEPGTRTRIDGMPPPEEVRFSPDDRWIAAETMVAGRSQIAVRPFPAGAPAVTISPHGGHGVVWPKTGSRLFYQRNDEVVAVTYSTSGGRFSVGPEQVLFRLAEPFRLVGAGIDGRFLLAMPVAGQQREVRVVLNCDVTAACR